MKQKKIPLSLQIFLALGLGIAVGMAFTGNPTFAVSYIKPFGTIFLNLLKFVVVPIVFFSILSGIISMSDIRKVGSIGVKTLVYYTCTTAGGHRAGHVPGQPVQGLLHGHRPHRRHL